MLISIRCSLVWAERVSQHHGMMSMHAVSENSCYCCSRPRQNMDVDAALSELGMLSSVTDVRKQHVAERNRRRTRQISEPSASSLMVDNSVSMTPSNSPDKSSSSGYKVIKLNPQFVTSLSSSLNQIEVNRPQVQTAVTFGSRYNQDSLDNEARSRRLSRLRYQRFRKPYELPWLQRHSIDVCYGAGAASDLLSNENSNDSAASEDKPCCSTPASETAPNMCLLVAPEKPRPKEKLCSSSSGSPEKTVNQGAGAVARSKSLDDLDFSKLRLAEAENHNFIRQKKEIDSVSQYMQNLNVNE